jgi:hypothetical protein
MHAVVVRVTIGDFDTARKGLREEVVPRASQAPGFIAGYWTRSDDGRNGLSMALFESEDAAQAAAERVREQAVVPETVTLESVEVREVVEHAEAASQ